MKRVVVFLLAIMFIANFAFAGGDQEESSSASLKVGMVTDAGTIDDKSFNQGTWEGILEAEKDMDISTKYLKPVGTTEADYMKEIGNLYDAGFRFMVTPGFKFETTIFQVQDKYPDCKFVLIDGAPHNADWSVFNTADNTVSIFFAEHESGFLAGVASALQIKEGEMGFIGGMEIPPVQKFNWGFQQGVAYANDKYGTTVVLNAENIIYQGTFSDVAAGQQLAAQMYDKGVSVIFAAAGGVGVGAINEAKTRMAAGEDAWIVGVDLDQYADGIYEGEKSVILTSAMKHIELAGYDTLIAESKGEFPGGKTLYLEVGVPEVNPNLGEAALAAMEEVKTKIEAGDIEISDVVGDLFP
ncbi:MAG: BMP family ABC transporter substrate-binding protein [Clostridiales bacterium]|nr:BMP family ABC transporter substrate-binding protein [Clostridiales bacterium]